MVKETIRTYYDNYHVERLRQKLYDLSNLPVNIQLIDHAQDVGLINKDTAMLDVGCGSGLLLSTLINDGYTNVTGIDISSVPLQFRKIKNPEYTLCQADTEQLPFATRSFGAVCSFDSLEHVTDIDRFIRELARVTTENGIVLFRTPNSMYAKTWEVLKGKSWQEQLQFHPSLQGYWSLRDAFARNGFRNLELYKLPIAVFTTKEKIERNMGPLAAVIKRFPWEALPMPIYPVFYGIASK